MLRFYIFRLTIKMSKFFDLPDEILLLICRYLSSIEILYSFCTPSKPDYRLHRVISDYYRKIKIDRMKMHESLYLFDLLSCSNSPFDIQSLVLSNEYIPYLIKWFFMNIDRNLICNLKSLELIDCNKEDVSVIPFEELESLSIRMYKDNDIESIFIESMRDKNTYDYFLFRDEFKSIFIR